MLRSKPGTSRTVAVLSTVVLAVAMFASGAVGAAGAAGAATKAKATTVKVVTVPGVGAVLVDPSGKTLYTLTDASGAAVACTGQCPTVWPPYTVATAAKVKAPRGVKSLSATADTHQVTWKGLPLYTFAADTTPKTASGEGIQSFGGTWHVVKSTARSAVTPTTSGGGSGYGY